MGSPETLVEAALRVLNTADPFEKARLGDQVADQWLQGSSLCLTNPPKTSPCLIALPGLAMLVL